MHMFFKPDRSGPQSSLEFRGYGQMIFFSTSTEAIS